LFKPCLKYCSIDDRLLSIYFYDASRKVTYVSSKTEYDHELYILKFYLHNYNGRPQSTVIRAQLEKKLFKGVNSSSLFTGSVKITFLKACCGMNRFVTINVDNKMNSS